MNKKSQQSETAKGRRTPSPKTQKAVRPFRNDGYVNVLNKYGTSHDNSEAYHYEREPLVPDMQLTTLYEGNGLFSKIIDTPAEEALKHGYELNINNDELEVFVEDALDELEWEEKAATAIKWARLYGGAIIVMLIDDGGGLEQPVNWKKVKSIDELRVFERAVVQPDYASLYMQDYGGEGKARRTSRFGEPEFYYVNSMYGSFKVHESRCLVFKNGVLPEQVSNSTYQMWGMPEYIRIKRALRETTTAHSDSVRLLERSVQAIYKMKNLSQLLATDDGEEQVLKRLEVIDMAKGLLNSIAIDGEGEEYDFKTFQFSGVKDVIDSTCNMLSALTNIPQTLLFGRSPSGMNATGESDLENYYNYVERIQKLMLKKNLRYLLDIIFRAGVASKELTEEPDYKLEFKPLWSMSESEQAAIDQQKAATSLVKAQTTQVYVDMGALDPTEVRSKLASDDEYNVEDIIEEDDEDLLSSVLGATEGQIESEAEAISKNTDRRDAGDDVDWITVNGAHIPLKGGVAAGGGGLEGKNLSGAKSEKPTDASKLQTGHGETTSPSGTANGVAPTDVTPDSFKSGTGDFEISGNVKDMYLTDTAREKISAAVETVKTASDLKDYLKKKGIELETSYEPLQRNMDREIPSVKEQIDYVIASVEQYEDLGGISSLKAVHIYEADLEVTAQYSYRAKGEGEVADEGHLYISDRANGFQVAHEFAHAYADSSKPEGMDVVEWSAKLNKMAGLSDEQGAYFGASADVQEAERFANACGEALAYGNGNTGRLEFLSSVANIVKSQSENHDSNEKGDGEPTCVSVLVIKDGKLLCGTRVVEEQQAPGGGEQSIGQPASPHTVQLPKRGDFDGYAKNRRDAGDEDVDWITVNGAHIPLKGGVAAGGGGLEGKNLSGAKSEKPTDASKPQTGRGETTTPYVGETSYGIPADVYSSKKAEWSQNAGRSLSDDEVRAMVDSTAEYTRNYKDIVAASSDYSGVYESRGKLMDSEEKQEAEKNVSNIEKMIALSDKYNGQTMRAMTMTPESMEKIMSAAQSGDSLSLGHLSSWTTEESGLKRVFHSRNEDNDPEICNVVLECRSKSGVSIKNMAAVDMDEVLYPKDAKFKVTGVDPSTSVGKYDVIKFTLEEVDANEDGSPGSGNHDSGRGEDNGEPTCVGVLVIKDGRVLTGIRKSESHPFEICGPGGHIEPGETPEQAAIRETEEEFGITPTDLTPVSVRTGLAKEFGIPAYFVCTEYDGDVRCYDQSKMVAPQWSDLGAIIQSVEAHQDNLFPPFADSIRVLNDVLTAEVEKIPEKGLPNSKEHPIIRGKQIHDEFVESEHPREENGKFTESGEKSGPEPNAASAVKAPKPTQFVRNGDKMEVTKDTRIKIGSSQRRTVMIQGTITGISDFAGTKDTKPVEKEPELMSQYPQSKKGSWRHTLGYGKVRRKDGKIQDAEIHWFESDDVGQVSWKVKRFIKGGKK